ncbi:cobyrinate a,c-diamide synthase [Microvirga lotononidis]|uniref:Hydrogenobyrinate a,c-diamide synthase n=1 Tax=Microvirga lotononidis TaxID=864069 RepID=I4YWS9_9HYPH|nr:cobyrinate a,c-diamide synthase [Microvirga lotononidis]EIM28421.1 cobyrinic acid a,c-diamide synthase [Microvirga lotononidis]WQO27499.1 cobyrinate a,c-diamide synthase [Microvirga lotononidis]
MSVAPGLLIAAPRSGSGKTTIVLGLQRALARRGLRVRGVKCGPDYIDPAFHAAATGAPSFNLDSFAMGPELLEILASQAAGDADLVLAEGSMGLFDGIRQETGRTGASADIAALFGWPVILVLDVSGHAQSAAAVALGCARFDPRIEVAGVVLNKVAGERHRRLVEDGMARIGLPVLGAMARNAELGLPERHLGLVQAGETDELGMRLEGLANAVESSLDIDRLIALAGPTRLRSMGIAKPLPPPGQRIALASDMAFSFVYPHVLSGWRAAGAEIVPFSPLADEPPPPDCDACWLPGGYPELHAGRIAEAACFLDGLRRFAESRPVHGECGGYMVLGRSLEDGDGTTHAMAGLLPVETSYAKRRMHLGYRVAHLLGDGAMGPAGQRLVGHEFHYASVTQSDPSREAAFATITDAEGNDLGTAGHRIRNVTGSFFHVIAHG